MDGDGQVDSLRYTFTPGDGGMCPCTIRRSQVVKVAGSPLNQGTSFNNAVDGVINSGNTLQIAGTTTMRDANTGATVVQANDVVYWANRAAPVFAAFDRNGNPVAAGDIVANPAQMASIRTIRVTLNILTQPGSDLQTQVRPAMSLVATAKVGD